MIAGGPRPVAPFSHAVETDGFIFVTGQMPDTPGSPGELPDGIEGQTRAGMENLRLVLTGPELSFERGDGADLPDPLPARLLSHERDLSELFRAASPAGPNLCRCNRARLRRADRDRPCLPAAALKHGADIATGRFAQKRSLPRSQF